MPSWIEVARICNGSPAYTTAMSTATLLIGHGSRSDAAVAENLALAQQLAARLGQPVEACFLEFSDPPIIDGIRSCIEQGATNIVALPLFLGPAGHQKNDVPAVINWARKEWPHVNFLYGTPLGAQYHLAKLLGKRAEAVLANVDSPHSKNETALVVVGRGSRDPDSNSEVSKLTRLLYEGRDYGWVETAFFSLTTPRVADVVAKCARLGAKRVVILPYLLFTGKIFDRIVAQSAESAKTNNIELLVSSYLFPDDELIEAVLRRYEETVSGNAKMTCDLCKYRNKFAGFEAEFGLPQTSDASHGMRGVPHDHGLLSKMEALLPPQYQNGDAPSFAPMGSADFQYDPSGAVAWNEMWEDFCDLALAGGATHRSTLLEPPTPAQVAAAPEKYGSVVAEIERGIGLVTNCEVVTSASLGWVGVRCHSEEMAIWLMRAIIAENVLARREGAILYLPASPHFTLKAEIKNVITVVAKTFHYWTEHVAWKMSQ